MKEYQALDGVEQDCCDDSHYDGEDTLEWDPDLSDVCSEDSAVIVVKCHNSEEAILGPHDIIEVYVPNGYNAASANAINGQSTLDDNLEDEQTAVRNDTLLQSSAIEEPLREHQVPDEDEQIARILQDGMLDSSPEEPSPVIPGVQVFPLNSNEALEEQEIKSVTVRRVVVVKDLVEAFINNSIMHSKIKMKFVNELAIDGAGVSRDVYTAFWEQFFEMCEGETESS